MESDPDLLSIITTVIAGISVIAALVSVRISWRNIKEAKKANDEAKKANDIARGTYQLSLSNTISGLEKNTTLRLTEVQYRAESNSGAPVSEKRLEDDYFVKVTICGELTNNTKSDLLVTARGLDPYFNELFRQNLINIGGMGGQVILKAEQTMMVVWEDRREVKYWKRLQEAIDVENGKEINYDAAEPPGARFHSATQGRDTWNSPSDNLSPIERAGFQIVTETRALERIGTRWIVLPGQAPIHLQQVQEEKYVCNLRKPPEGDLDDSVLYYRWHHDTSLVNHSPPPIVHLKGRQQ